jgi:hypothetical protein
MTLTKREVWLPFLFAVALSGICLVTHVVTVGSGAWVPAFLCFLPMAFLFSGFAQSRCQQRIAALEAQLGERVR